MNARRRPHRSRDDRTDRGRGARAAASTAEAVLDDTLARIAALDGRLHAFCTLDEAGARGGARRRRRGSRAASRPAPLAGVPVAHQGPGLHARPAHDLRLAPLCRPCARGRRRRRRAPARRRRGDRRQDQHLGVRLRRVRPQRAVRDHAQPLEPRAHVGRLECRLGGGGGRRTWCRSRSAATAAARCACRRRCAAIYGIKPSWGRVPVYPGCRDERHPGISSWESLEHIGPMTATVADAALALSVLVGPTPRDRASLPAEVSDWTVRPADDAARRAPRLQRRPRPCASSTARSARRRPAAARAAGRCARRARWNDAHPGIGDIGAAFEAIVALDTDRAACGGWRASRASRSKAGSAACSTATGRRTSSATR